jgi:hypothetical protein
MTKLYVKLMNGVKCKVKEERGDAGIGFILTIIASLIVAAFVLIPGVRTFGGNVITGLTNWWSTNISPSIFPTN